MGQKLSSSNYKPEIGEEVTRNRFDFIQVIGRGGFGKVWHVQDKKSQREYALKELKKVKIIDRKSEIPVKYERELLSRLSHSFMVNMHYAFQDYHNLFLVMDLLKGGDLRYHVTRQQTFTEEQTKFFLACIIIALEYIHSKKVMHRDIKPENLVLDDKGYVRLTDFGIAKVIHSDNSNETSGTPGYMSPEVMEGLNHNQSADYYALGIIGYEFMTGRRPYYGRSSKEIREHMTKNMMQIKSYDIPRGWSYDSVDFINKLLIRNPDARLGHTGINELKEHSWYMTYPWEDLYLKRVRAPFVPSFKENFDKRYCQGIDKVGLVTRQRYDGYINNSNYDLLFENFTFYCPNAATFSKTIEQPSNNLIQVKSIANLQVTSQTNIKPLRVNSKSTFKTIKPNINVVHSPQRKFHVNIHNSSINSTNGNNTNVKKNHRYQNAFNYSMKLIEEQRNRQKMNTSKSLKRDTSRFSNRNNTNGSMTNISLYKTNKSLSSSKRSISTHHGRQYPNEYLISHKSTGLIRHTNKKSNLNLNLNDSDHSIRITQNQSLKKIICSPKSHQVQAITEKIRIIQRSKSNFGVLNKDPSKKPKIIYDNQLHKPSTAYHDKIITSPTSYLDKRKLCLDSSRGKKITLDQLQHLKLILSSPKKITINKKNNLSSSNSTLPSNSRGNKETTNIT